MKSVKGLSALGALGSAIVLLTTWGHTAQGQDDYQRVPVEVSEVPTLESDILFELRRMIFPKKGETDTALAKRKANFQVAFTQETDPKTNQAVLSEAQYIASLKSLHTMLKVTMQFTHVNVESLREIRFVNKGYSDFTDDFTVWMIAANDSTPARLAEVFGQQTFLEWTSSLFNRKKKVEPRLARSNRTDTKGTNLLGAKMGEKEASPSQTRKSEDLKKVAHHPNRLIVKLKYKEQSLNDRDFSDVRELRSVRFAKMSPAQREQEFQEKLQNEDPETLQKFQVLKQQAEAKLRTQGKTLKDLEFKKQDRIALNTQRFQTAQAAGQAPDPVTTQMAREASQESRERVRVIELKEGVDPVQTLERLKKSGLYEEVILDKVVRAEKSVEKPRGGGKGFAYSRAQANGVQASNVAAFRYPPRFANLQLQGQKRGNGSQSASGTPGFIPTDGLLVEQWFTDDSTHAGISALSAWYYNDLAWVGYPTPVVAVVDSGIAFTDTTYATVHPDFYTDPLFLYSTVISGWDFYEDNPIPEDQDGHGTAVASLISAAAENDAWVEPTYGSMVGMAWNTNTVVMPLRFLGPNGSGYLSDEVDAIYYAVDNGAWSINASFGSYQYSQLEKDALAYAEAYQVIVVASAGNNDVNTDTDYDHHFPSGYNLTNVLSVGSSNQYDNVSSFSNYGQCTVDLYVPGTEIMAATFYEGSEQYPWHDVQSGSSYSAAIASGVLANILARYPSLSVTELMYILRASVDYDPSYNYTSVSGGRMNMDIALQLAYDVWALAVTPAAVGPGFCLDGFYSDAPNLPRPSGGGGGGSCGGSSQLSGQAATPEAVIAYFLPFALAFFIGLQLRRRARVLQDL